MTDRRAVALPFRRGPIVSRCAAASGGLALLLLSWAGPAVGDERKDPGLEIFVAQKCGFCHGIESHGVEAKKPDADGGDLSDVGSEHDAEWIEDLLLKKVDTESGKPHPKGFKGKDADLQQLVDFLAGLVQADPTSAE